ncbi:MAG: alpha/beta hydrolase [Reichenbachiella sp.]|uniref:alpha/beta fold hydrolase n=1 Tax=Reichenbachiella sp. TaxID=2184521 RepID=UPI003263C4A8
MKPIFSFIVLFGLTRITFSQTPVKSEMINVNGVDLHYETYGKGEPLLLLHGYTQSSLAWKDFVDAYSKDYTVYLIDLRGHGQSSPFNEPFSVRAAAKDILALITELKLEKIKGIGFSFGGDVLLQLSSLSPETVETMAVIGSNANWNAQDYPDMLETFTYNNIEEFAWIRDFHSGGEEQIKLIIEQLANYNFKMSDDELRKITARTLLILGDREQITIQSVMDLHEKLAHSALWIIPDTGHYAHTGENKDEFIRISKKFLASEEVK